MIKTARQLKDLIRNLSREKSADAQILMRNYMMERFLERIELMTLNRLLNLPWRLSKEQLSWLKNRLKDRRPDVRALAQEQYEMRFPPRHLEDDEFNFFDEESFIE